MKEALGLPHVVGHVGGHGYEKSYLAEDELSFEPEDGSGMRSPWLVPGVGGFKEASKPSTASKTRQGTSSLVGPIGFGLSPILQTTPVIFAEFGSLSTLAIKFLKSSIENTNESIFILLAGASFAADGTRQLLLAFQFEI